MKRPVDDIVPQVVFHVDGVLAVNWRVAFSCTLADVGEMVMASAVRDENARHTTTKTQKRGNCTTGSPEKRIEVEDFVHGISCEMLPRRETPQARTRFSKLDSAAAGV